MVVVEGRWNTALQHFDWRKCFEQKKKNSRGRAHRRPAALLEHPCFATSGDVAGAVEQTWTSAQGQIKTVVNNVVFPRFGRDSGRALLR